MDPRDAAVRVAALKALYDRVRAAYNQARTDALAALTPGDRLHAALSDGTDIGTVTVVNGRTTPKVGNPEALLAWVKTNAPDEVETVERVRESYVGVLLSRCENADGTALHGKTGELLPGVWFDTGDPYTKVTQTDAQLAAFTDAWADGELGGVIHGLTPIPLVRGEAS